MNILYFLDDVVLTLGFSEIATLTDKQLKQKLWLLGYSGWHQDAADSLKSPLVEEKKKLLLHSDESSIFSKWVIRTTLTYEKSLHKMSTFEWYSISFIDLESMVNGKCKIFCDCTICTEGTRHSKFFFLFLWRVSQFLSRVILL